MTQKTASIFFNQAFENLHLIERHIMKAKLQLRTFSEYRNDLTRNQLVAILDVVRDLNNWIISNANQLDLGESNGNDPVR